MEILRKETKVKKIFGEKNPKLKGYVVFEDSWISEFDKVLFNKDGDMFLVLDFQELEEHVPILPLIPISIPVKRTYRQKFSCMKLDKIVNVGDVFYTYT